MSSASANRRLSIMALCDQGYLCDVCGLEVEELTDSDLYLRYVIGQIPPECLHTASERHLRCNPTLSQFIVHPLFQPVCEVVGVFDRRLLDDRFREERERLVTAGFQRLLDLRDAPDPRGILAYPIPRGPE
jgi:hypothetical protein